MEDEIKIRLRGEGVKPGSIRSKELAEILESIEDMVVSQALKVNPDLHKDQIIVGLYQIEDRSIGLNFKANLSEYVMPPFLAATKSLNDNDFEGLTSQSIKSLHVISNFSKKYNCDAIIGDHSGNILATITPRTEIPKPTYIEGPSEIIGRVVRVGGKTPRAMIDLVDGSTMYCEVPKIIAKELGKNLYSYARFHGQAKWDTRTLELEEFKITHIEEFDRKSPNSILSEIASVVGDEILKIQDVDQFVSDLRNGEDV